MGVIALVVATSTAPLTPMETRLYRALEKCDATVHKLENDKPDFVWWIVGAAVGGFALGLVVTR